MLLATILEPDVKTTATYGGGEVLTITADASLTLTGKRVSNLDYPGKFHISAIVRDGVAQLPEPRTELAKGDRLSITVTREALPELKRLLDLD